MRCYRHMIASVAAVLALLAAGCDLGSDWYSRSRELKRVKQERIKELQAQGLSEEEAAAIWNRELSVRQTEGAPLLPDR